MAKVLIIGASDSPERYSYKALHMLKDKGHEVLLFSPKHHEIEGHQVYQKFADLPSEIDVVTLYVNPKISSTMIDEIVQIKPRLTIFNPGTENPQLTNKLDSHHLKSLEACTLVLLTTDQFDGLIP